VGSSSTQPVFENVSKEIVEALKSDDGPLAQDYKDRAVKLLHEFQSWATNPPDTNVRSKTVQEIIALHREVQEYRSHKRDP
jgi:hypothetical protein